jgi:cytochrome c peroxidase
MTVRLVIAFLALLTLAAPGASAQAPDDTRAYAPGPGMQPDVRTLTELGRALFFDPALSASGAMSCASCHNPNHAYGPPDSRPVRAGGRDGSAPGKRAVPSLRYLQTLPVFTEHGYDNDGDDSRDNGPTGGHNWDGRAATAHDQARIPLMSAHEMANKNEAELVARLGRSMLAPRLRAAFGPGFFEQPERGFRAIVMALEVFQQSPADFYPYSSKYDEYLRGRAMLDEREKHGLRLFNDRDKGNCASCHPSAIGASGAFPQFTDYGFNALGAPRNAAIAANRRADYYDLGLCGPDRRDLASRPEYCGLFRAPTLRNAAIRTVFFHNGIFHRLEDVMQFYVRRDLSPARWYRRDSRGGVTPYDDMPAQYRGNVNVEPPFDGRPGGAPALSARDIGDIIAFLRTLTDRDQLAGQRDAPATGLSHRIARAPPGPAR